MLKETIDASRSFLLIQVCSNHNETWDSDCEVYRMRCLCEEGNEQCLKKKYKHVHVDYFGGCRGMNVRVFILLYGSILVEYKIINIRTELLFILLDIEPCTPEEMADFPRRMRDWLFNVMKDLAYRNELTPEYMELEREAENSLSHKWVNAVIWKFCDLDSHPHDR